MLAVPVRACPADAARGTVDSPTSAMDASMPAMHHHAHGAAATPPQTPPAKHGNAPCDHQMPCCPPASTGCTMGACATSAPVALTAAPSMFVSLVTAGTPQLEVWHGVSLLRAPEPPPPRA